MKTEATPTLVDDGPSITDRRAAAALWTLRPNRRLRRVAIAVSLGVVLIPDAASIVKGGTPPPARKALATSTERPGPVPVLHEGPPGHETMRTENVSYAANTSRAWGTDTGLHRVTVVAGTLTIERGDGRTRLYAPGMGYVAGWTRYVARNDMTDPVEVLVSYLRAPRLSHGPDDVVPND